MTDENDVTTCNDLMQILRHKLECLILKHTDLWLDIDQQLARNALQNTLMLDLPLSAIFKLIMLPCRSSSMLFLRIKTFRRQVFSSLRQERDGMRSPTLTYLVSVVDHVSLIQIHYSTVATVSCVSEKTVYLFSQYEETLLSNSYAVHFYYTYNCLGLNWIYEIHVLQISLSSCTLLSGFVPFFRNRFPGLFQDFSRTQIDFSRAPKFTLTPTLLRSRC